MWCKSSQTSYTDVVFRSTPHPEPTMSESELAISKQSCSFFCISPCDEIPWKPLTLCFSPQAGGTVRCGRLRDQPRPPGLLRSPAGVRPPAGTAPLQLCRTLSKIQTHLPLQELPTWPGGAVQRLFIKDGKRGDFSGKKNNIEWREGKASTRESVCRALANYLMVQRGSAPIPRWVNVGDWGNAWIRQYSSCNTVPAGDKEE